MAWHRNDPTALSAFYRSEAGQLAFRLQWDLIRRLVVTRPLQRLLAIGCGPGVFLNAFKREGLTVNAIDSSQAALDLARDRIGTRAGLHRGPYTDLPFEDNEFDLVVLIHSLETVDDPERVLAEAFRVTRSQVYIGTVNGLGLQGFYYRMREFWAPPGRRFHAFSVFELHELARQAAGRTETHWAASGFLPPGAAALVPGGAWPPACRNPFGAFLGFSARVRHSMRTDNLLADSARVLAAKAPRSAVPTTRTPVRRPPVHLASQHPGGLHETSPTV